MKRFFGRFLPVLRLHIKITVFPDNCVHPFMREMVVIAKVLGQTVMLRTERNCFVSKCYSSKSVGIDSRDRLRR